MKFVILAPPNKEDPYTEESARTLVGQKTQVRENELGVITACRLTRNHGLEITIESPEP